MRRMIFAIISLILLSGCTNNKNLVQVDPLPEDAFPNVNVRELICSGPDGNIAWRCERKREVPFSPENKVFGFGHFGLPETGAPKAIVIYEYRCNGSKKSLKSQKAVSVEEFPKCECFKKYFKGALLDAFNQYSKKGFVKSPSSITD